MTLSPNAISLLDDKIFAFRESAQKENLKKLPWLVLPKMRAAWSVEPWCHSTFGVTSRNETVRQLNLPDNRLLLYFRDVFSNRREKPGVKPALDLSAQKSARAGVLLNLGEAIWIATPLLFPRSELNNRYVQVYIFCPPSGGPQPQE